jgi:hypothetical protein
MVRLRCFRPCELISPLNVVGCGCRPSRATSPGLNSVDSRQARGECSERAIIVLMRSNRAVAYAICFLVKSTGPSGQLSLERLAVVLKYSILSISADRS